MIPMLLLIAVGLVGLLGLAALALALRQQLLRARQVREQRRLRERRLAEGRRVQAEQAALLASLAPASASAPAAGPEVDQPPITDLIAKLEESTIDRAAPRLARGSGDVAKPAAAPMPLPMRAAAPARRVAPTAPPPLRARARA